MRWLLIGKNGMLGSVFATGEVNLPGDVACMDIEDIDITNPASINCAIDRIKPDAILNCSAYTNVDGAETEQDTAYAVNASGVGYLAQACRQTGAFFIHFSTDFIFDGQKHEPYFEDDTPNPINRYGLTKLQGEEKIRNIVPENQYLIIRTSWLFGPRGKNFIQRILQLSEEKPKLSVVDDQHGCPTYTLDLARATLNLIEKRAKGVFHVSNQQVCTWFDLARFALDTVGKQSYIVERITSDLLNLPAKRPAFSQMSAQKYEHLCNTNLRNWQDAAREYIEKHLMGA